MGAVVINSDTDVVLSKDGNTATVTFATSIEGENLAVVVEPITIKADDNLKTERYAGVLTYKDTVKPTVTKIESITGGDQATTATITFSEPIASVGTIKIDGKALTGANYTLAAGDTELELTGLNLDSTKEHTLEIVSLVDTSTSVKPGNTGNVTSLITKKFNVTVDKVAPTITSIEAKSDTALVFTFSKKVDLDTKDAVDYMNLFADDLSSKNDLIPAGNKFSEVAESKGTKFEVIFENGSSETDALFTASKKSHELTVQIKDKVIVDAQGNKVAGSTKKITIKKDEAAPKVTNVNYRTDVDGKVKELVFTFDEDIDVASGVTATDITTLLDADVVNVDTGVKDTIANTLAIASTTMIAKDNVVTVEITPKALSGKYTFKVLKDVVEDKSLDTNANKAHNFTLDFGAPKADETFEIDAVNTNATGNIITVTFLEAAKGGTGANSATLLGEYKLNSKALPVGTIKDTDTAAIFMADSIVSQDGKKTLEKYTGTVEINDNIAPEVTNISLTSDNNLLVTFSEELDQNGAIIGDFEITINDTKVDNTSDSITILPGSGSDAGKYIINLGSLFQFTTDTEIKLTNGDILVATGADVRGTFKYATSSLVDSIKVKVIGEATLDKEGNKLVKDTLITVK